MGQAEFDRAGFVYILPKISVELEQVCITIVCDFGLQGRPIDCLQINSGPREEVG